VNNSNLDRRGRELAEALGGHWAHGKGMGRCPAHDDRTPSLGLRLGSRALLLHCFAGCATADVLAALARRGIATRSLFDGNAEEFRPTSTPEGPDVNAVRLWRNSAPVCGTAADRYLSSRAIGCRSTELRYLEKTPLGPRGRASFQPALVAALRTDAGVIAIQRTFLTPTATLADMESPKRGLGRYGVASVRLHAPISGRLGLAEGIESALSAYSLRKIPCWATLGNERFGLVSIPDSVTELHLFLDADAGGNLAEARGRARHERPGRTIVAHRPDAPFNDWNDALRARCAHG
jgi:putative DNA primase/helicase